MKILAIDSTANTSTVALLENEALIALYTVNTENTHSETLLPMVKSMLESASVSPEEIDAYAVANGPGSFTGVRIGVATVKGLAFGRDKRCVAVSTTEALSENLEGFDGIICPVMNARRGQVYTCIYKNGKPLIEEGCMMLDELISMLEKYDEKIYFTGDGYELTLDKEIKNKCHTPEMLRYSNAYSVGKVAYRKIVSGDYITDTDLRVNYLRKPQAEREREEKLKSEGKL
ncbi:MAG: tRNA (adenosine(37)-N6)-threonylcarbamoyltransferase complex dimerization subunit type 1 TsaB [Clostridia bacterium]|nr:tRNA (adenosine(37)-N6)-threonylcarbamoyltransferase complex dimerization subunit type 1 TsaB [Clostridia bacterium]